MTTDTPPPPRRKWHLQRWLILLATGFLAYGGWTQYAFRAALKEAEALGWEVYYADPAERIRAYWKEAFKKETWLNGVSYVSISTSEEFEQHLAIVYRLNPKELAISSAATLRDLSPLKPLTRLQGVVLHDCTGLKNVDALKNLSALQDVALHNCTGLTNVDALKNLSALKEVSLFGCTGLTSVDGLKNLSALHEVVLIGCTGLTDESVASLKAALPKTDITGP